MTDYRARKLAELVLDYSIELKKDDKLFLQYDPSFSYYAELFVEEAVKRGAKVREDSLSFDSVFRRGLIERFNQDEFKKELERRIDLAKWCNTRILIDCESNPDYAQGIPEKEKKIVEFNKEVIGPYKEVLYRPGPHRECEVRWNIVGFPYAELAKNAGMSLKEFEDFVYSATIGVDWKKMGEEMKILKSVFDNAKDVHIYVPGNTDLHLSLEDRKGEICDGKCNMPDGEVFYCPIENSINGKIHFQHPSMRDVGKIEGIKLRFEDGKVVGFDADSNKKGLEETLNVDEGARRVGELGIGFNRGIQKSIMEVLFDEKIGGTIHLALGDSISENLESGGGKNKSVIHWDIVCDLRKDARDLQRFPGGWIKVDGTKVQENGEWKL